MHDLAELRLDHFTPHLKTTFALDLGGGGGGDEGSTESEPGAATLAFELVEAREMPTRQQLGAGQRRPFSLLFRAPAEPALDQGAYALTHPELGAQVIFLVPVNADGEGRYYEAVFT